MVGFQLWNDYHQICEAHQASMQAGPYKAGFSTIRGCEKKLEGD